MLSAILSYVYRQRGIFIDNRKGNISLIGLFAKPSFNGQPLTHPHILHVFFSPEKHAFLSPEHLRL